MTCLFYWPHFNFIYTLHTDRQVDQLQSDTIAKMIEIAVSFLGTMKSAILPASELLIYKCCTIFESCNIENSIDEEKQNANGVRAHTIETIDIRIRSTTV